MKNNLLLASLFMLSSVAYAQDNSLGEYIGGDIGLVYSLNIDDDSGYDSDSFPLNFYVGYDMLLDNNPRLGIGFEVEYRYISKFVGLKAKGASLNLRPKYYIEDTPVHIGLLLGFGQYDVKKTDVTTQAWQYGVEVGYQYSPHWLFKLGYRELSFDGFDISGMEIGMKYYF